MFPDTDTTEPDRLVIHRLAPAVGSGSFADDVRSGLTAAPKMLLPKYFYDDLGSRLFEAICYLPEYYVTRDEREILRSFAGEIIGEVVGSRGQSGVRLVELGSGSAEKTRYLLDELVSRRLNLRYLPVDVSESSLVRSSQELLRDYPHMRIEAYAADYDSALEALSGAGETAQENDEINIVLFLGSSIGNLDPGQSRALLRKIRKTLPAGDALLLGADLRKSADILVPAYDDSLGVTAAFNLNLLVRINRELGGDFDVSKFQHRAVYNERESRMEMHLLSREPQVVSVAALDLRIELREGESIHTENSYKFDTDMLARLGVDTGFRLARTWFDADRRFSFNLLTAI